MMKRRPRLLAAGCWLLATLAISNPANATTIESFTFAERIQRADKVAEVEVLAEVQEHLEDGFPIRRFVVQTMNPIKGTKAGDVFDIMIPGAREKNPVPDAPVVEVGDRLLTMTRFRQAGGTILVGWHQGVFRQSGAGQTAVAIDGTGATVADADCAGVSVPVQIPTPSGDSAEEYDGPYPEPKVNEALRWAALVGMVSECAETVQAQESEKTP